MTTSAPKSAITWMAPLLVWTALAEVFAKGSCPRQAFAFVSPTCPSSWHQSWPVLRPTSVPIFTPKPRLQSRRLQESLKRPICRIPSPGFRTFLETQQPSPSFSVVGLSPFTHHAVPSVVNQPTMPFLMRLDSDTEETTAVPGVVTGVAPPRRIDLEWDYGSKEAGARVAEQSPELKNVRALQVVDRDSYMITRCSTPLYFVLQLPENVFLRAVALETRESFTDTFKHVALLASNEFPTRQWRLLATLRTNPLVEREIFNVENECRDKKPPSCWVRYVKVVFLDTYRRGDYHYCTLTRLQLFGSDILQKLEARITNSATPSLTREIHPQAAAEQAAELTKATEDVWSDTLSNLRRVLPKVMQAEPTASTNDS